MSKTTKKRWSKLLRCLATSRCYTLMSKLMVFQFKPSSTVVLKAQSSAKTAQQHVISCICLILDLQVWLSAWDSLRSLVAFTLLNSCWKLATLLNVRSQCLKITKLIYFLDLITLRGTYAASIWSKASFISTKEHFPSHSSQKDRSNKTSLKTTRTCCLRNKNHMKAIHQKMLK